MAMPALALVLRGEDAAEGVVDEEEEAGEESVEVGDEVLVPLDWELLPSVDLESREEVVDAEVEPVLLDAVVDDFDFVEADFVAAAFALELEAAALSIEATCLASAMGAFVPWTLP